MAEKTVAVRVAKDETYCWFSCDGDGDEVVRVPEAVARRWMRAKRAFDQAASEIEKAVAESRGESPAVPVGELEVGAEFVRAGKSGTYRVIGQFKTKTIVVDGDGDERLFHPETSVRRAL